MISPQPISLVKYLGKKRSITPPHIKRLFYLSFEDAFWDILSKKHVAKNSRILIPNFYCKDVETNIKAHGYKISHYSINCNLKVNILEFKKKILDVKPSVVIIFHPVGITSNLILNRNWIKQLDPNVILIEDCVHKTLDPKGIHIYKKNHFLINSLRKVVPLQGTSLYGRIKDLDFDSPPYYQSLFYSLKVNILWCIMVLFWKTGKLIDAEKFMLKGYDLIGDKILPAKGSILFKHLENFIDYAKIKKIKIKQSKIYQNNLGQIKSPPISTFDFGNLRGWPIILPINKADRILKRIRDQKLLLRFELNDCDWSKNQKIIYLPLGPYLKSKDIRKISTIVKNAWQI